MNPQYGFEGAKIAFFRQKTYFLKENFVIPLEDCIFASQFVSYIINKHV